MVLCLDTLLTFYSNCMYNHIINYFGGEYEEVKQVPFSRQVGPFTYTCP